MKHFYERYWDENQAELQDFQYKWPAIKKYIPTKKNISLLDFGCGMGKISSEVLNINPRLRLTGADISKQAVRAAKKRVLAGKFVTIDEGKPLPFRKNTFDFILANDVIEHIYDTQLAFSELSRVLKPGGKLLVSVPYHGVVKNIIIVLIAFDLIFNVTGPHIRFFTKKSLTRCLTDAGLTPVRTGYFGRFFPIWNGMYILAEK